MSEQNAHSEELEQAASDAQILFPDVVIKTVAGDITVRPLSFARLMSLTPVLEALVLHLKVEGISIDPENFHPSFEELTRMYLAVAPVAMELMGTITGQDNSFFDKISVREGAQIFVACVKICWAEIAPFLGLFTPQKPGEDNAPLT